VDCTKLKIIPLIQCWELLQIGKIPVTNVNTYFGLCLITELWYATMITTGTGIKEPKRPTVPTGVRKRMNKFSKRFPWLASGRTAGHTEYVFSNHYSKLGPTEKLANPFQLANSHETNVHVCMWRSQRQKHEVRNLTQCERHLNNFPSAPMSCP